MLVGFVCSMWSSEWNVLLLKMGVLNSAKLPSSTRRPSFHSGTLWTRRGLFHRAYSQGRLSRQKCAVSMAIWTEYGNVVAIVLLTHNRKSWCQVGFVCTWLHDTSVDQRQPLAPSQLHNTKATAAEQEIAWTLPFMPALGGALLVSGSQR